MATIPCLRTKAVIMFGCHCSRSRITMNNNTIHFNYNHAFPSSAHLNLKFRALCREVRLKEALHNVITTHREVAFATPTFFQNNLINMYVKCGRLVEARKVFDKMTEQDCISWNMMIAAYRRYGYSHEALTVFRIMQRSGVQPDRFTFSSILPICAKIRDLEQGMNIHQIIIESTLLSDVVVASALIDMYAKCGSIRKAREVFDKMPQRNVVSWNVMIAGYAQNGVFDEALRLFKEMPQRDVVSWNAMIAGCAQNGVLDEALNLFKQMPRRDVVSWNTMIAGYAQNGAVDVALGLFREMPQRNVVSWNAMISGYVQNGFIEEALETFKQMQLAGFQPDHFTLASIIPACATIGALEQGMGIHQSIMESGLLSDTIVVNALIDMYAKCGSIHKAWELFDKMPQRSVITWNAMITGFAQNGYCRDALTLFELMKHSGTYPDHASFACVIFACSHAGLVDEGCKYFEGMSVTYCITRTIDHYVCMVDLLGRAGYIVETLNFIIKMPIKPMAIVWMCLLAACKSYKNIVLGVFTATLLFELDPKNAATYVLLSNLYAELGKWGEVQKIRRLIKDRGIKKVPGCSWIEVHKKVHVFV